MICSCWISCSSMYLAVRSSVSALSDCLDGGATHQTAHGTCQNPATNLLGWEVGSLRTCSIPPIVDAGKFLSVAVSGEEGHV
ncbi:hypothetical protein V8F06_005823 [Rhypophila decipiens]